MRTEKVLYLSFQISPFPSPLSAPRPDVVKRCSHAAFSNSHRRPVHEPGLHPICERLVRLELSYSYTFNL